MDPDPSSYIPNYNLIFGLCSIILLLIGSAFISGTEVALFSLTPQNINRIKKRAPRKGRIIAGLLEKPKKLLATIVITNNFFNLAIIILFFRMGGSLFSAIKYPYLRFIVEVVILTFFLLLFGEVIPKLYASRRPVRFSKKMAFPLYLLSKILWPISVPLRNFTLAMQKKFGYERTNFSVDQLSQALELTDYGNATEEEQKILEGIVTFGSTEARQVMTPRIDIFAIDVEETFKYVITKISEKGFSRIPVYKDNIDHIQGVLFIKDLLPYLDEEEFDWQSILRKPFFVPENKKLDNLLKEFQGMKSHLAVVVDEYGDTSGIISLEDILEEIVGDIIDEFDDEDINFTKIDDRTFIFDGKINLRDFYRATDVEEEPFEEARGEAETLGGFVLEISENFPVKGHKVKFKGNTFTVESVDKGRIKQLKVILG